MPSWTEIELKILIIITIVPVLIGQRSEMRDNIFIPIKYPKSILIYQEDSFARTGAKIPTHSQLFHQLPTRSKNLWIMDT